MRFGRLVNTILDSPSPNRASLKRGRSFADLSVASLENKTPTTNVGADDNNTPSTADAASENSRVEGATASPHPVKVLLLPDDGEEEEEELRLLLGCGGKVFVRPPEPLVHQKMDPSTATGRDNGSNVPVVLVCGDEPAKVALAEVPWESLSSAGREELAEKFEQQFLWELSRDIELVQVFRPFFTSRTMKIIGGGGLSPQFSSAKTLMPEMTDARDGLKLRPYQFDGVQFMMNRFHSGMPCILGDDMGLGKTAQVSSFLNGLKTLYNIGGPHLIVVPLNTVSSWAMELARWAPTLRVLKYLGDGKERVSLRRAAGNKNSVFITSPALFSQDRGFFCKRLWVVVVVDEAHKLKERTTVISCAARRVKACFRLAVTGTPIQNSVKEVWNIMMFLYPSFCAPYTKGDGNALSEAKDCAKLMQHVMLRRTKTTTDLGIPPRVDEPVVMVEPTRVQRVLLSRMIEKALKEDSGAFLQNHLSHQRVVCSHPLALRLLATEGRVSFARLEDRLSACGIPLDEKSIIAPSGKMIRLDYMLRELHAGGHRCLIFSNFTCVLDLLQALCTLRGYSCERIDGNAQRVERELSMKRFNAPTSKVFVCLISTTSGGVGITLTSADIVILFDAHFNPQVDRQAADRAHRLGQTRTVHVFRFCCKNTIEERINDLALQKLSLGDFIVDGGAAGDDGSTSLSASSIRQFLLNSAKCDREESVCGTEPSSSHQQGRDDVIADAPPAAGASVTDGTEGVQATVASMGEEADPEDDVMIEDILRMGTGESSVVRPTRSDGRLMRGLIGTTHECFVCGERMHPLQPLFHCSSCTKAYHAECVGEAVLPDGVPPPRGWTCPRHSCDLCGKVAVTDGALFMCYECPAVFCFDCLDPNYFDLDGSGVEFSSHPPRLSWHGG